MKEIFKIFKIDLAEAERISTLDNNPHSHDFEELLIGKEGQIEHFIDFENKVLQAPFISFVTQGKIHRIRPMGKDGKCHIWAIRFKSEFISETTFQLYSSFHDNANFCMKSDSCFDRLDIICTIINTEFHQSAPDYAVIRDLLRALFTMIESERNRQNLNFDENKKIQNNTFKNFLLLLNKHYKESHDVNFYAEKLFMSARNLNIISQKILQQSVSEIIETRKLTEAKNLLITTDLTIAEIGYELGFKEKTYFTHAFKRKAGVTPTEFRKEMSQIIS